MRFKKKEKAIQDKNKQIKNNKISKYASNSNNTTFDPQKKTKKKGLIISDCTQLKFYSKDDVTVPFS